MKKLFLLLLLAACATTKPPSNEVYLTRELKMTMPKFSELGRNLEATQLVTAHYKDQTFNFEGHISVNKDRFLMVGLDGFGRRAMTITWTEQGINYEAANFVPSQLKPENILADIVIIYWPENLVRKELTTNGKLIAARNKRSVYIDNKEIIQAQYQPKAKDIWDGDVTYKNLEWGYSLDIQSQVTK